MEHTKDEEFDFYMDSETYDDLRNDAINAELAELEALEEEE